MVAFALVAEHSSWLAADEGQVDVVVLAWHVAVAAEQFAHRADI